MQIPLSHSTAIYNKILLLSLITADFFMSSLYSFQFFFNLSLCFPLYLQILYSSPIKCLAFPLHMILFLTAAVLFYCSICHHLCVIYPVHCHINVSTFKMFSFLYNKSFYHQTHFDILL